MNRSPYLRRVLKKMMNTLSMRKVQPILKVQTMITLVLKTSIRNISLPRLMMLRITLGVSAVGNRRQLKTIALS
jgi:hypothetical protein